MTAGRSKIVLIDSYFSGSPYTLRKSALTLLLAGTRKTVR